MKYLSIVVLSASFPGTEPVLRGFPRDVGGPPAVIDCQKGKGQVLMFANKTHGSDFLLFNAMLNFEHLDAGKAAARGRGGRGAQ